MIISPCISICKTDPVTGYCYGCGRSNEEKKLWKDEKTSDGWKKTNLEEIQKRMNGWQLESFKESYNHKTKHGISLFKKKVINESLSVAETQVRTRELIRLANESVSIQTFRVKLRALVYHVVESSSIADTEVKKRGLIKAFNESLNNAENMLRYRAIIFLLIFFKNFIYRIFIPIINIG